VSAQGDVVYIPIRLQSKCNATGICLVLIVEVGVTKHEQEKQACWKNDRQAEGSSDKESPWRKETEEKIKKHQG
jgi:hypothetical protein